MQMATEQRRNKETSKKEVCIIGGESKALGFHQETMEESRKRQDRFCIKTLHYIFHEITFVFFLLYGSTNVIRTKRYFSTQVKYYIFQLRNSKSKTLFFEEITSQRGYGIQKPKCYFQFKKIAANFGYKIQNYRRYLNVSRNIII